MFSVRNELDFIYYLGVLKWLNIINTDIKYKRYVAKGGLVVVWKLGK
jgi:hypothetical protein